MSSLLGRIRDNMVDVQNVEKITAYIRIEYECTDVFCSIVDNSGSEQSLYWYLDKDSILTVGSTDGYCNLKRIIVHHGEEDMDLTIDTDYSITSHQSPYCTDISILS